MKILLVDDEIESRQYLAEFLRELGYEVTEAGNGGEAFQLFQTHRDFDLVLTDIRMPQLTGIELLNKIRNFPAKSDTAVILFTAFSDVQTAVEALRGGAYDYLFKPIKIKELVAKIEQLKEHQALKKENEYLNTSLEDAVFVETEGIRNELSHLKKVFFDITGVGNTVFVSEQMKDLYMKAQMLHTDRSLPVLISGETGTGKELVARFIHYGENGEELAKPFIDLNCSALSASLFESELFGYEKGSFTGGANSGKRGKIDLAEGGTLFLDEITEMPFELQAKLLRVIEEKSFYRVGGLKKNRSDIRIICCTNADIEANIAEGRFRKDLYYRLNTAHLVVPPLRERQDDIIAIATLFLNKISAEKGKKITSFSPETLRLLRSYQWPGNVRELKNVIEYAVLLCDETELTPAMLKFRQDNTGREKGAEDPLTYLFSQVSLPPSGFPFEKFKAMLFERALALHSGNKTKTAQYLGISVRSLSHFLKKNNLSS